MPISHSGVQTIPIANIGSYMGGRPLILRVNCVNAIILVSIGIVLRIFRPEEFFQARPISRTAIFHASSEAFRITLAVQFLRAKSRLIVLVCGSQPLIDDVLIAVAHLGVLAKRKSVPITVLKAVLASVQGTAVINVLSH